MHFARSTISMLGVLLDPPQVGTPLRVTAAGHTWTTSSVRAIRQMGLVRLLLTRNSIYVLQGGDRVYGPLRSDDGVADAIFGSPLDQGVEPGAGPTELSLDGRQVRP
jgi:hypothetical protein